MAGEKTQPGSNDSSDSDLPVSVLVSGEDGEAIVKIMNDESQGNVDIDASIVLTRMSDKSIEFPYVKGSPEALQVLASRGWGIHAVPQEQKKINSGWQLFITQHDKQP